MKVMTSMYTIKKGGSYDRFIMLVEAFLEREWEVHCLSLTPIPIKHSLFHNKKMYFPFRKGDGLIAKIMVLCCFPFWAVWVGWRHRIDLIVAFGSLYAFIQSLAKWWLKKPMVTLIRGRSSFGLETQNSSKLVLYLYNIIENVGLHFSDRIITNNMSMKDEIFKKFRKKKKVDVQVLFNDIPLINKGERIDILNIRKKYNIPDDAKVLVTAGIIHRGKNIEVLIKCLTQIEMNNIYILVVGDSSTESGSHYKKILKELVNKLQIQQQVIFTGWIDKKELWSIFQASDLFVLPSINEGMPNALLEALGVGLPCIGSKIPGIVDILQYDELLFDPKDEGALAHKIQYILNHYENFQKIKLLCEEREKEFIFDWKERVFQILTVGIEPRI
ncbi:MAG: glycosyltransferase [Thermodesulfobacteriota bacterium]